MLQATAAHPAPHRAAAGGERAALEAHGVAAGQRDVERASGGQVAARGDPAAARERERVVHRHRLDDAVQVEPRSAWAFEQPPGQPDLPPGAATRNACGERIRGQLGEVGVVARRLQRVEQRRVDQAAGLTRRRQRRAHGARELGGDEHRPVGVVDAQQLAVGGEAREARVALPEERAHARRRAVVVQAGHDLAAHRAEAMHAAHDALVCAWGGACGAATRPPRSCWSCRSCWTKPVGGSSRCSRCLA